MSDNISEDLQKIELLSNKETLKVIQAIAIDMANAQKKLAQVEAVLTQKADLAKTLEAANKLLMGITKEAGVNLTQDDKIQGFEQRIIALEKAISLLISRIA